MIGIDIGEVWANTLYNVYAALVAEDGFEPDAIKETGSHKGNVVFMHNFMDGLLLQPCNPTSECWNGRATLSDAVCSGRRARRDAGGGPQPLRGGARVHDVGGVCAQGPRGGRGGLCRRL
jgi:hypothetical protein